MSYKTPTDNDRLSQKLIDATIQFVSKSFVREQIEILTRHLDGEAYDPGFVEDLARFIVDMARLERDTSAALERCRVSASTSRMSP